MVRILCHAYIGMIEKNLYKNSKKKRIIDFFIYICRPKCDTRRLNIDY